MDKELKNKLKIKTYNISLLLLVPLMCLIIYPSVCNFSLSYRRIQPVPSGLKGNEPALSAREY